MRLKIFFDMRLYPCYRHKEERETRKHKLNSVSWKFCKQFPASGGISFKKQGCKTHWNEKKLDAIDVQKKHLRQKNFKLVGKLYSFPIGHIRVCCMRTCAIVSEDTGCKNLKKNLLLPLCITACLNINNPKILP